MAKGGERSFRYKPRSKESVSNRANMRGGGYDSIFKSKYKRYKIRDGKNVIRVLPPTWEEAEHYGYDIHVNYQIGADNASYLSLSKMNNEADPIAEARREADKEGDEKLAKSLQPRHRVVMWVIDRMDEDEGPQLFDAPFTVDKALANLSLDEDTKEVTMLDDPDNGCDFRFYREGKGLNTDYDGTKMKLLKPSPLHEDEKVQEEWVEYVNQNPIPECLQFYSYDHISAVFNGAPVKSDDDEDEDKPKSRRRPAVDEDEETDAGVKRTLKSKPAADDEDEAKAEETKPKRARSRLAPEDDEDETPPAKKRPAADEDYDAEADEKPKAKRRPAADEDEDEDPKLKRKAAAEEDEDAPKKGESIRDRLKRRRQTTDEDDD